MLYDAVVWWKVLVVVGVGLGVLCFFWDDLRRGDDFIDPLDMDDD